METHPGLKRTVTKVRYPHANLQGQTRNGTGLLLWYFRHPFPVHVDWCYKLNKLIRRTETGKLSLWGSGRIEE